MNGGRKHCHYGVNMWYMYSGTTKCDVSAVTFREMRDAYKTGSRRSIVSVVVFCS